MGVAQALLGQPRLVIVDEPTVGLDPEERIRLRNLLADLAGRCTVILSTHIIKDIGQSCNRLAVIGRGELLFHGTPGELIAPAQGQVWTVETGGERPVGDMAIFSSVSLPGATRYRVVGRPAGPAAARPVEASLEDGYIWLMRHRS